MTASTPIGGSDQDWTTDPVAVVGLGLWLPGWPNLAAWLGAEPDPATVQPVGRAFDRVSRRRAGALGRAIADAAAEAMTEAEVDAARVATVVGSSIGEAATMIGLLDQMWRTHTPLSPAAFTVSVHNAASGLLSISSKNVGYTTSIAADYDTPAAALLEGIGLVACGHDSVVVVCGDDAAPHRLVKTPPWTLLAAAVVLAPSDTSRRPRAHLRVCGGPPARTPRGGAELDPLVANNPQVGLVDLVDAIARGVSGAVALDREAGRGLYADVECSASREDPA